MYYFAFKVKSSSSSEITAKKWMVSTIIAKSKYIDSETFLKPVKRKRKKDAKAS
jgi:hypothetical protein